MRGDDPDKGPRFYYFTPEDRIPQDHPLRPLRAMVDRILRELSPAFDQLYAKVGRPSVAPERLLRALLLQILYTIRSERLLVEQLDYNLLFRWFVGLDMEEPVWDATTFSKNRERLLRGEIAQAFFDRVVAQARAQGVLSDEHFTVDATLVEAWAGLKSFRPKDDQSPRPPDDPGNPTVNFHRQRRRNDTHQSTTDPEARLFRKGNAREARLYYMGHVLMENRHGLAVGARVTPATGTAEWDTAAALLHAHASPTRKTVGADKAFDTRPFVQRCRALNVTPHIAQNTSRRSAIDERTTRHTGYAQSQRTRKRVEEIFGWVKTVGALRKTRHRGTARVHWTFVFTAAVYNLVRLRNLALQAA